MTEKHVLIVGSGVFGISTAYHLLKRGYANVTVVDRSETLPAPDAASTDLNKIVRSAYEDLFYCQFAREAIQAWKDREVWGDVYHECGFVVVGVEDTDFGLASFKNDVSQGARIRKLEDQGDIKQIFPPDIEAGDMLIPPALFNLDGGWAAAADGVKTAMEHVVKLGGKILGGKVAKGVVKEGGKTVGIRFEDGSVIDADVVVLATGSWTGSTFAELSLDKHVFASGQALIMIQLNQETASRYRNCPCVLDHQSGFYVFPPNKENIVKIAAHGAGFTHKQSGSSISIPRTVLSSGEDGLRIPQHMVRQLRAVLARIYPELARMPFLSTRLCWYTYTNDSDWIIDRVEGDPALFVATGGSGHGYKFLPVIGRLIADRIEGKMPPNLQEKFSLTRDRGDFVNWGWQSKPSPLDLEELCTPDDLNMSK